MPDGLEIIFLNSAPRRTQIQRRGRSDKKSETGFSGKVSSRLRCANAGEFQNTFLKGSRHSERERRPDRREFLQKLSSRTAGVRSGSEDNVLYHNAGRGNRCSENRCSRKPPFRENWGSRGRCPGKRCLQEARSQKRA